MEGEREPSQAGTRWRLSPVVVRSMEEELERD